MIYWIYGNSGAGKSSLVKKLRTANTVILDGDELRHCWELSFSKEDRWEQNMRAARLAVALERQGFEVIVSTICPYKKLREEITQLCKPKWILVEGGKEPSARYPFER